MAYKPRAIAKRNPKPIGFPKPPALPKPAAPAPAPRPAGPVTTPGPGFVPDSVYNNATSLADRRLNERMGQLDTAERQTKFEYGIDDPTNPNSRMAALKRMYLARSGGVLNSAGNQLYSGATEQSLQNERLGNEQRTADLRANYERALGAIRDARTSARTDREEAGNTAFQDWLGRQPEPEAPAQPEPATPKSQVGPRIKNKKGHYGRWHTRPDGSKVFVLE